jgi:hypothetical protein
VDDLRHVVLVVGFDAGCKSFGVWPLSQAAEACVGTPQWPVARPVPQVSIEFDVVDAAAGLAAQELERAATGCCTHLARSRRSDRGKAAVTLAAAPRLLQPEESHFSLT